MACTSRKNRPFRSSRESEPNIRWPETDSEARKNMSKARCPARRTKTIERMMETATRRLPYPSLTKPAERRRGRRGHTDEAKRDSVLPRDRFHVRCFGMTLVDEVEPVFVRVRYRRSMLGPP